MIRREPVSNGPRKMKLVTVDYFDISLPFDKARGKRIELKVDFYEDDGKCDVRFRGKLTTSIKDRIMRPFPDS